MTEFELAANDGSEGYRGDVPAAFGGLTGLVKLRLHWHHNLGGRYGVGGIPSELGNLVNLVHLQISVTQVNGEIPSSIGNLTKLEYLDLGGNGLSGDIPSEIWNLTKLRTLRLHANDGLTGTISSDVTKLTKPGSTEGERGCSREERELGALLNLGEWS